MSFLILLVAGFLIYTGAVWLFLRFMRFVTACDGEIRAMTESRPHARPVVVKPARKMKSVLRLRPASS